MKYATFSFSAIATLSPQTKPCTVQHSQFQNFYILYTKSTHMHVSDCQLHEKMSVSGFEQKDT
jgi:hypothetical protein